MIISKNLRFCRSFLAKGTGLMFRFPKNFAYIFEFSTPKKRPITMWFVFFAIDIVFVDDEGKVVEVVEDLKPFYNYYPKETSVSFIELPSGSVSKFKLKAGSILIWDENTLRKAR